MALPLYSIVVPLYNTARYLPDLLRTLERQRGRGAAFELECVFVDDASPDDAGRIARDWLARTGIAGRVIEQENSGVSAARNNGLDAVSGEWVTFIDSDDFVSDGYVAGVQRFVASLGERAAEASLVSCKVVNFHESEQRYDHAHSLKWKFVRGDRLFPLAEYPEFIQSQAATAFFPVERLRASGVRFLEGLHAAEDAVFVASYLITQQNPAIACVAGSEYFYRKRASGDSAVQQYKQNPDFYFGRFTRGYLPLFERAERLLGAIPRWLGQYFLYDISWLFPREQNVQFKATHLSETEQSEVLGLISDVLRYLDPMWIREFTIPWMAIEHRNLLMALKGAPLLTDEFVLVSDADRARDLVRLSYYFVGDLPDERITTGGRPAGIAAAKIRRLDYLGQTTMRQRIVWVRVDSDLAVHLDGVQRRVVKGYPWPHYTRTRATLGLDSFSAPSARSVPEVDARPALRRLAGDVMYRAAATFPKAFAGTRYETAGRELQEIRKIEAAKVLAARSDDYAHAWLFMDRLVAGDDNAEALHRYVRAHRPDINAFFVLAADSAHWERLREAGARLLAYGSAEHWAALMRADFVISSHLDVAMVEPMPVEHYPGGKAPWRYVYLQHGVRQHDLSIWFNKKPISLIATASTDEQRELVEDDSPYALTELEARLTGFPRHDAIVERSGASAGTERRTVLFAPTWRKNMTDANNKLSVDLAASEFGRNWFGLLNDPRLHALAERFALDLAFLPHPNFREGIPDGLLSERVTLMTEVEDMTELMVASRLVVTDYSSIFFDAAVAGADIAYFQFDADSYLTGAHTYVPGDWDYGAHGFGPVAGDVDAMIEVLARQLDPAHSSEFDVYRDRVRRTMPNLDGRASSRVLEAILSLNSAAPVD
ncbi:glycosyltransferase [Leucobacter zeae]|nr:glycosyltransferase [Leucobacter zeae]